MKSEGDRQPAASRSIEFGRFTALPLRRKLLADGAEVELGGRAFDLLVALIEAQGAILGKDELISLAWPGRIADDNNLQVQIAALRKALGEDRDLVRTVAGRGYKFAGAVRNNTGDAGEAPAVRTNLPGSVTGLIGRSAELQEIARLLVEHRLITLAGAGGIGKTRLGLEAARRQLPHFSGGVWLAELGQLSDAELIPATVAGALGMKLATSPLSPERVAAALGSQQVLLVLDNCEHLIDDAARMAEAMLRASPAIRVLATSREPLRLPGEAVFRVPSLEVPAEQTLDKDAQLRTGAVQLFMARAQAAELQLTPDRHLDAVCAICRQLDGIPLAIELAAARAAALGVIGLAARLNDSFRLLTGGFRTALPRHQTLHATFEWSYNLLPAAERMALRRFAVFSGHFSLESASVVAAGGDIVAADCIDYIANLVAKSLITTDIGHGSARYRLLATTRAYCIEKLSESGEFGQVARRQAEYYRDLFEKVSADWEAEPAAEWRDGYSGHLDNVRAALDWAFSPDGDVEIGIALAAAAVPLWMQLSLIEECRSRVAQALSAFGPGPSRNERRAMQLYAALGASLLQTKGPAAETGAAWAKALEIAENLDDVDYRLRTLWGLWVYRVNVGEFRSALPLAEKFVAVAAAKPDPADSLVGARMTGVSQHFLGDQANARRHTERMLDGYVVSNERSHIIRFQFDQTVAARAFLALMLWLQGYPDRAVRMSRDNAARAQAAGHALSLCYALEVAGRVLLLADDLAAAEEISSMLLDHSERDALEVWNARARCAKGERLIRRGDAATGLPILHDALGELSKARFAVNQTAYLGALAEGLASDGQVDHALSAIAEALELSGRNDELWTLPELLRIRGEIVLLKSAPDALAVAEEHFRQGIDLANRQSAMSWELRCATSLARLWKAQGRPGDARELLASVYCRFTEGFETKDLKAAQALLNSME